ncbi:hypothetical protein E4U51_003517 [Claviceps purpurea]|nr:hypothetical protein E4U51_003517 [Claviceps purpurea]
MKPWWLRATLRVSLKLFIKREHGAIMKSKDIYNLLCRRELTERRVMSQAERAIKLLEDHGFTLQHDIEEYTGHLKAMSCVHPQSLKDFLQAPDDQFGESDTTLRTCRSFLLVLNVVSMERTSGAFRKSLRLRGCTQLIDLRRPWCHKGDTRCGNLTDAKLEAAQKEAVEQRLQQLTGVLHQSQVETAERQIATACISAASRVTKEIQAVAI